MTAKTYDLNSDAAREADSSFVKIDKTGAYTGAFTLAMEITARSGATGVSFNFATDSGEQAQYLSLYTANAKGQPIFGEKQLYALMTCLNQRSIQPQTQQIELYDFDSRSEVLKSVAVYPTLMHTPIGVVLQKEFYTDNQGQAKDRLNLIRFFDPVTRQTASEILDKTEARKIDAQLKTLKDKHAAGSVLVAPSNDTPYDDDLPF
jgi:hypothetical protein